MAPLLLEDEPVPPDQLLLRALRYAQIAGCTQATMGELPKRVCCRPVLLRRHTPALRLAATHRRPGCICA